jgi:hypothetical protein
MAQQILKDMDHFASAMTGPGWHVSVVMFKRSSFSLACTPSECNLNARSAVSLIRRCSIVEARQFAHELNGTRTCSLAWPPPGQLAF